MWEIINPSVLLRPWWWRQEAPPKRNSLPIDTALYPRRREISLLSLALSQYPGR